MCASAKKAFVININFSRQKTTMERKKIELLLLIHGKCNINSE